MTLTSFQLRGRVVHADSGTGVADVTVSFNEVVDSTLTISKSATTDADGRFAFTLSTYEVSKLLGADGHARITLRVFDDGTEIAAQDIDVTWERLLLGFRYLVTVAEQPPVGDGPGPGPGDCTYTVSGRVLDTGGHGQAGRSVRVVAKTLRSETELGLATTGDDGAYLVTYGRAEPCDPDDPKVNLLVSVVDVDRVIIKSAPLVCNAPPHAVIDVILGEGEFRGKSRFELLVEAITPHLEGTSVTDLTVADVDYLACVTEEDPVQIAYLIRAFKLGASMDCDPKGLFALFMQGFPTLEPELRNAPLSEIRQALQVAAAINIVPPWPEGGLQAVLDCFKADLVADALGSGTILTNLFDTAGVSNDARTEFVNTWIDFSGTPEAFWADFQAQTGKAADVQFLLQAGALTAFHPPLMSHLFTLRSDAGLGPIQSLAKLDTAGWVSLLGDAGVGAPPGFPDPPDADAVQLYAATLARAFEDTFPTAALGRATRIDAGTKAFLEANPTLELGLTPIDAEFAGKVSFPDPGKQDAVIAELKVVQRLSSVLPQFDRAPALDALRDAGIDSAQAIQSLGRGAFLTRFAARVGGPARAAEIYDHATVMAARASTIAFGTGPNNVFPFVIRLPPDDDDDGVPDVATLFGSLDFCSCRHCRSVLSPAAYLVALLQFIRGHSDEDASAYQALLLKRGDIPFILLDCENTNTVLPTLDLVNELLELRVLADAGLSVAVGSFQTTWKTPELLAHPEHLQAEAYVILREGAATTDAPVFPWILPFDLFLAESRLYLEHLGVEREALMRALRGHEAAATSTRAIAVETLGLSPSQATVLLDDSPSGAPWGLSDGSYVSTLEASVAEFVDRSGLSFDALLDLLHTDYFGMPADTITFGYEDGEECTLDGARFVPVLDHDGNDNGIARLHRAHRFIRLQRTLGWPIYDLDAALGTLGQGSGDPLDADFLRALAGMVVLQRRFPRVPRLELLSWWGPLWALRRRVEQTSPYREIFNNRLVVGDDDRLAANDAGTSLRETVTLTEVLPLALGGLRISRDEFDALAAKLEIDLADTVTLESLSGLQRHVSLARALELSVADLLTLIDLTGQDPFGPAGAVPTEVTAEFVELVDGLRQAEVSVAELDFILRSQGRPGSDLPLSDRRIVNIVVELTRGLQAIEQDTSPAPDENRPAIERLEGLLGLAFEPEVATGILAVVAKQVTSSEEATALLGQSVDDFVDAHLAFLEPGFVAELKDQASSERVEKRASDLLAALRPVVRDALMQDLVVQKLAEQFDLDADAAHALLTKFRDPEGTALARFTADSFVGAVDFEADKDAIKQDEFLATLRGRPGVPEAIVMLRRLHKAALVVDRFDLSAETVTWLLTDETAGDPSTSHAAQLSVLDLRDLVIHEPPLTGAAPLFEDWNALRALVAVRNRHFVGEASIPGVFTPILEAGDLASALSAIAAATGWDEPVLNDLATPLGIDLSADVQQSRDAFARFGAAIDALDRLGVDGATALGWVADGPVSPEVATAIKGAAKAKHDNDAWPGIIEPVRNRLREMQRDALSAKVLAESGSLDRNRLFGEFLTDVDVTACHKTSRIKLALSSLQTFVQRVLMGLEPDPDDPDNDPLRLVGEAGRVWQVIKRYRVWEASRKVFLWPENFVKPELRDDKSPLFEQLENALLQDEITDDSVERAYRDYLEGLNEVARLHVAGVHQQRERSDDGQILQDRLHVFARTAARPFEYYYRQWVDEAYWTPWEKLDLGIESEDVVPALFNRRLMLFWPTFNEQALEPDLPEEDGQKPKKFHEIRLSWSERKQETWGPVQQAAVLEDDKHVFRAKPLDFGDEKVVPRKLYFHTEVTEANRLFLHLFFQLEESELEDEPDPRRDFQAIPAGPPARQGVFENGLVVFVGGFIMDGCKGEVRRKANGPILPLHGENRAIAGRPRGTVGRFQASRSRSDWDPEDGLRLMVWHPQTHALTHTDRIINTPTRFEVIGPYQDTTLISQRPIFFQDRDRVFMVTREKHISGGRISSGLGITSGHDSGGSIADPGHIPIPAVQSFPLAGYYPGQTVPLAPTADRTFTSQETVVQRATTGVAEFSNLRILVGNVFDQGEYLFHSFYHPYVCLFLGHLNRYGIEGLLDPQALDEGDALHRQAIEVPVMEGPDDRYEPSALVKRPYPVEDIDFDYGGAYSDYNWELFFHAPMLIADRLMAEQRFAEAQRWLHFIFDPTARGPAPVPDRFWKIKPFFEADDPVSIEDLLEVLNFIDDDSLDADVVAKKRNLRHRTEKQIEQWSKDRFNPHLLARLRPFVYQRAVVIKYIENMIAWGDFLFRQDTIESINEATQLYILASQILGDRPVELPEVEVEPRSYNQLRDSLDAFGNALVDAENLVPVTPKSQTPGVNDAIAGQFEVAGGTSPLLIQTLSSSGPILAEVNPLGFGSGLPGGAAAARTPEGGGAAPFVFTGDLTTRVPHEGVPVLYFCVPPNDKMLAFWDTVADRLFKIRNCLNIEGVRRELPLFQPPISPELLVEAAARGIDIGSAVNNLFAPLPKYRFRTMLQLAKEVVGDVKELGRGLLSALQSKDAEALAELRASQEVTLLQTMRQGLEKQLEEAQEQKGALEKARAVIVDRRDEFQRRIDEGFIPAETAHLALLGIAGGLQVMASINSLVGAGLSFIPQFNIGTQGVASTPVVEATIGGANFSSAAGSVSSSISSAAAAVQTGGSLAGFTGSFERQKEEWRLQVSQADKDLERIDQEITAAGIRIEVAESRLREHDVQVDNAQSVDTFLRRRYTNSELYEFMSSELSRVYFQAYQLAFDLAQRAERCYQFQLGADTRFIKFGYWDNRRKGLLAGERLTHDLRRIESAFFENNRREYELTKRISLAQLDPVALLQLQQTGVADITVPEVLFDLDHPSHYFRRLRSVNLTIPAVTGPFTTIPAKLTLVASEVRTEPTTGEEHLLRDPVSAVQAISTSTGQNDAGLFQENLDDPRYLPFEGKGVISSWRLELPAQFRQFDYSTISDVVLELRYTAREGGEQFKTQVVGEIEQKLEAFERDDASRGTGLVTFVEASEAFPNEWRAFRFPAEGATERVLNLEIDAARFHSQIQPGAIEITKLWLLAVFRDAGDAGSLTFTVEPPGGGAESVEAATTPNDANGEPLSRVRIGAAPTGDGVFAPGKSPGTWTLRLPTGALSGPDVLEELGLLLQFKVDQES